MMHTMRMISYAVLIMGAILLGINGLFNFDLIASIFGAETVVTRIMYALVGVAGIVVLATQYDEEHCVCPDCNT